VRLAVGQRVVFVKPGADSAPLGVGIIAAMNPSIAIRCRGGGPWVVLAAEMANRVCVVREETDAERWARHQLDALTNPGDDAIDA
jgi:hypothetical protein